MDNSNIPNPFEFLSEKLDAILANDKAILERLTALEQAKIDALPTTQVADFEPDKRFYKISEVAKKLGYSHITIRKWLKEGKINGIQNGRGINGTWRIEASEIERFINELKQKKS